MAIIYLVVSKDNIKPFDDVQKITTMQRLYNDLGIFSIKLNHHNSKIVK